MSLPSALTRPRVTGTLALVGIALYVVLVVVTQLLPPHFDPISQYESDLGAGDYGWLMSIAFVVRGLIGASTILTILASTDRSRRRTVGLTFFAISSACSALLAVFPTDIVDAATEAGNTGPTVHGAVHGVLAIISFLCSDVAFLILARVVRVPGLLVAAIAVVVAHVLLFAVTPSDLNITGLAERLLIALILFWQALAVIGLMRRAPALG